MLRLWQEIHKQYEIKDCGYLSPCWLWLRGKDADGYGQFHISKKIKKAHKYIYELTKGKVPEGKILNHLCEVRHCVNPEHLEITTSAGNTRYSKKLTKLTREQVIEMRVRYAKGEKTKQISIAMGQPFSRVNDVVLFKCWKDVII